MSKRDSTNPIINGVEMNEPPPYNGYINGGININTETEISHLQDKLAQERQDMEPISLEKSVAFTDANGANNLDQFEKGKAMSASLYVKSVRKPKVKKFYKRQKKEVTGYETCVKGKDSHITSEKEQYMLRLSGRCANVTLLINIILVSLKVYSAVTSGSSSVLASLIENFMDVVSNIILIVVNFKVKKHQPYAYPHGKSRFEPIGVMLFAIVMTMTGVMMVMHSVEAIVGDLTGHKKIKSHLRIFDVSLFIATIVVKMVCFAVMYRWKTPSIKALSLDHLNDSMVNLVAFTMAFVGKYAWPYADPLGAGLIALLIIFNWIRTVVAQVRLLIGQTAKPKLHRQLLWLVVNHVHEVARPAYLRVSTFGETYMVDVGLLPNEGASVQEVARASQSLRKRLEQREDVAIAMVCLVDVATDPGTLPQDLQITPEPVVDAVITTTEGTQEATAMTIIPMSSIGQPADSGHSESVTAAIYM